MAWTSPVVIGSTQAKAASTFISGFPVNGLGAPILAGQALVYVLSFENIASATVPTMTLETTTNAGTWTTLLAPVGSGVTTTAGSGSYLAIYMFVPSVNIANGASLNYITSNQSHIAKACEVLLVRGAANPPVLRTTMVSAVSTAGTPSAVSGAGVVSGDLVIGCIASENTAVTGDADTLNGSWSAIAQIASSGGSAVTNQAVGVQWKIVTAGGAQTYNATGAADTIAAVFSLVPGVFAFTGTAALGGNGSLGGYRQGYGEAQFSGSGVLKQKFLTRQVKPVRKASDTTSGLNGKDGALGVFTDGKMIYFNGNTTSGSYRTGAFLYNTATDVWTGSNANGMSRADMGYISVNDKCYMMGGTFSTGELSTCVYGDSTGAVTSIAGFPGAATIAYNSLAYYNGFIYSLGGRKNSGTGQTRYDDHFRYEIATNTWTTVASPPASNWFDTHMSAIYGGKIYWIGDNDDLGYLSIYDPATNTWLETAGAAPTFAYAAGFQNGDDGEWFTFDVYAAGGASAWSYSPTSGWTRLAGFSWDQWEDFSAVWNPVYGKGYLAGGRVQGDTGYSNAAGYQIEEINLPVPRKPYGVIVGPTTPNTIPLQVAWRYDPQDNDTPQVSYELRWRLGAGAYTQMGEVVSSVPAGTMAVTGFANNTYSVSVRTKDRYGWGAWSAEKSFAVLSTATIPALTAPTSAPTTAIGNDTVTLTMPATLQNGASWYYLYRNGVLIKDYLVPLEAFIDKTASVTSTQTYTLRGAKVGSVSADGPASGAVAANPSAADFSLERQNLAVNVRIAGRQYATVFKVYRGVTGGARTLVHTSTTQPAGVVYVYTDNGLSDNTGYDYHVTATVTTPTTHTGADSAVQNVKTTGRAGAWATTAMTIPHRPKNVEVVGTKAYLMFGVEYSAGWIASQKVTEFDPATGVQAAETTPTVTTHIMGSVAMYNSELYCLRGSTGTLTTTATEASSPFQKYNPSTNVWTTLTGPGIGRTEAATAVVGSRIYFFCGYSGNPAASAVGPDTAYGKVRSPATVTLIYDILTDEWSTGAPVFIPNASDPAFMGGVTGLSQTGPGGAAVWGDDIYIFGGSVMSPTEDTGKEQNRSFIYNTTSNTWREGPTTPSVAPTAGFGLKSRIVLQDNEKPHKVYLLGGRWTDPFVATYQSTEAYAYDFITGLWETLPNLPEGMSSYGQGIVKDGKIFLFGGDAAGTTGTYFTYDPYAGDDLLLNGSGLLTATGTVGSGSNFTGSGGLSGSGTLTTSGIPTPIQASGLSGFGALTFVSTPSPAQTVALSGTGALTFVSVPKPAQSVALSGSGTLSFTSIPTPIQTLALSGSGTLEGTGVAVLAFSGSVALSGSGTLSGTAIPTPIQTVALSGSGALTFTFVPTPTQTMALSGSGTLTLSAVPKPAQTIALSGSGTLSFTATLQLVQTVALSGSGSLTGVAVSITSSGTATLGGTGTLSGVGTAAITAIVALSGAGTLSGAGIPTPVQSAALSGSGTLTGTGVTGSSGTATLTLSASAGAAAPASSAASLSLSGTASARGTASGSASLGLFASSGAQASAAGTASLGLSGTAAAQSPVVATASLTLSSTSSAKAPISSAASLALTASSSAQAPSTSAATLLLSGSATTQAPSSASAVLTLSSSAAAASPATGSATISLIGSASSGAASTGSALLSLTAAGSTSAPVSGSGSLVLAASSTVQAPVTSAALLTLTGSGAAKAPVASSAQLTLTGALLLGPAASTGSASLVLSATAATRSPASSSALLAIAGAIVAQAQSAGTALLSLTASAVAKAAAISSASLVLSAAANTAAPASGSASMVLDASASAGARASATASLVIAASAAAQAAASAAAQLVLSASAAATAAATAVGSLVLSAASTARAVASGAGTVVLSASGSAGTPVATTGSASLALTGSAAARAVASGSAQIVISASGETAARSTSSGSITLVGTSAVEASPAGSGVLVLGGSGASYIDVSAEGSIDLLGQLAVSARASAMAQLELLATGRASTSNAEPAYWNGAQLLPAERLGWWDGTAIQPVEILGVWNGTQVRPVGSVF